MEISEFLSYGFVWRAIITGACIAVVTSALGVFLVLRRLSLIGDGLSHASFTGISLGLLTGFNPIYVSIPVVMLFSMAILKLTKSAKVYGDAAIGMISALGIAGGVIISGMAGGFNVDLFSYLFGSILAVTHGEMVLCIVFSALAVIVIYLFYNELVSLAFDEDYAKSCGINVDRLNIIFVLTTSIIVVLSLKIVGIMLVSSLLVIPPVTALQFSKGFKKVILTACAISLVSVILGIYFSFVFNLPSGGSIVLLNLLFFVLGYFYRKFRFQKAS